MDPLRKSVIRALHKAQGTTTAQNIAFSIIDSAQYLSENAPEVILLQKYSDEDKERPLPTEPSPTLIFDIENLIEELHNEDLVTKIPFAKSVTPHLEEIAELAAKINVEEDLKLIKDEQKDRSHPSSKYYTEEDRERPLPDEDKEDEIPEEEDKPDADSILDDSLKDLVSNEEDKNRPLPTEPSLKEKPKRDQDRHNARTICSRFVDSRDLRAYPELSQCIYCGTSSLESFIHLHIPDPKEPLEIKPLCKDCCFDEKIREKADTMSLSALAFLKSASRRKYTKRQAQSKIHKWFKSYGNLIPPLRCEKCKKTERKTTIYRKVFDYSYPYEIVPVCPSCEYDLRTSGKLEWPDPIDLWSLINIEIPHRLRYWIPEILPAIRKKCQGDPKCFICSTSHKQTSLTLAKVQATTEHTYYFLFVCPDCTPTCEEDIYAGTWAIAPTEAIRISKNFIVV